MSTARRLIGLAAGVAIGIFGAAAAFAQGATISIASGAVGNDLAELQQQLAQFKEKTGITVNLVGMPASTTDQFSQYRLWLSAQNTDIDVYRTDVIWAPQLAEHFLDLTPHVQDVVGDHIESIIQSQTVDGKLVALPIWTDAPALYYRKDLLEKYGKPVPKTWAELAATAKEIMTKEREAGQTALYGYVFQGAAYEGLTCNALEWVHSYGGGQIVEPDGTISINNEGAVKAVDQIASWVGDIVPEGALAYKEEESRGVWQLGNSVFMRNWPYAVALGNSDDSAIKGKFDVAPLPAGEGEGASSAATLGGWNLAVSKYSQHQDEAVQLVKFLASAEAQKFRALNNSRMPTLKALYDDPEIKEKQPIIPSWKAVFENAVPRPSAPTKAKYNEVSSQFWTAVHNTLSGQGTAAENLELLEAQLTELQGSAW